MTILKIITLFVAVVLGVLAILLWKRKPPQDCINFENYVLIKESSHADECSKYKIKRKGDQIWFTQDDYSLFYIQLESSGGQVKLRGLDGYGIRDKEFKEYICKLVSKILEKNGQTALDGK